MRWNAARSFRAVAQMAVNERLGTDIVQVIEEINGNMAPWSIGLDGILKVGEVALGDGTIEKSNSKGLMSYLEKSGTSINIFKKVEDKEGNYLCVASSFIDSEQNNDVGTYLNKSYEGQFGPDSPLPLSLYI